MLWSGRRPLDIADDRPLFTDLIEATSDLSASPVEGPDIEFRGLSTLELPGILDLNDLKEREDSFVSDLLNEGYDDRVSPPRSKEVDEALPFGVEAPEPPLEGWLPMAVPICCDRSRYVVKFRG